MRGGGLWLIIHEHFIGGMGRGFTGDNIRAFGGSTVVVLHFVND